MSHLPSYPMEEHDARVVCADPIAMSYEWLKQYLEQLNAQVQESYDNEDYNHSPITFDELIDTALSHVSTDSRWGGDYIVRGGTFEGMGTDPVFWDKLAIFKEMEIPHKVRNNFFSCSC